MRRMRRQTRHVPVMMDAVLEVLRPKPGDVVVDCTVGLGGHAAELLRRVSPGGRLVGFDFDAANLALARAKLEPLGGRFELHHTNFAAIGRVLAGSGTGGVDAILADAGVASPQIDDPIRGFSYKKPGPLDMRMDPMRGQPASDLIARLGERELAEALQTLGDEEDAQAIARLIVQERAREPITTTQRLAEIVCRARNFTLERAAGAKLHPAARTFQALRMLVNRELPNLSNLLRVLPDLLKPGGRAAIITFHSGEDRLVKQAFREGTRLGAYAAIADEPVTASEAEIAANPRSRSAKLRWAERA
jgi:16S rRNA (cytosine1402-N4)-methyltransferase